MPVSGKKCRWGGGNFLEPCFNEILGSCCMILNLNENRGIRDVP